MYAKFFGLQQEPFAIAPDPRYLFMSERHRDALAHLRYGLGGGGGFVLLSGEIGAGKTTVCRRFLAEMPAHCRVAYIFNPRLSATELLISVCEEFGIAHEPLPPGSPSVKPLIDALNAFLLRSHAQGQNNVLIIDEAQQLSAEVLEQLRLLTNLETSERKLLQIILIGQPELREMLARPQLEPLAQRVIARFHLQAMSAEETADYVRHRLAVAGHAGPALFDAAALRLVHRLSRGVPRRVNLLCDRALLGAYAQGLNRVDVRTLKQAAAEVFGEPIEVQSVKTAQATPAVPAKAARRWAWWLGGSALLLSAAAAGAWLAPLLPSGAMRAALRPALAAASAASAIPAASAPAVSVAAVPAEKPKPAKPAAPTEAQRLEAAIAAATPDEASAWRMLAQQWQLAPVEGDAPCEALRGQQLFCLKTEGGLALLRLLDRPAWLTLIDAEGRRQPALLLGLDGQQARVQTLGQPAETLSLTALAQRWRGEFATLWRAPPGYQARQLNAPTQAWLQERFAQLDGRAPTQLALRVASFQRSLGLRADGLAGPITLMQLNRAAGVAEPRLPLLPAASAASAPPAATTATPVTPVTPATTAH
ncbi:AAA family ATPase [Paucibacter sp. APW11]|uniref:AAA family ATPase n=1 Tax=Roseateles aquae TaxID=3077235 RepID=A0ABU3PAX0_9BURK|nr:AAA family ATPase [Paucibacter sp. APW11]MDT8999729.1 AAA family ATPase [Paucibacter sp. APW11]